MSNAGGPTSAAYGYRSLSGAGGHSAFWIDSARLRI
jgi:hypothetical protein